ncbi:unnamed protein product [Owenia fusiformis]|uniref:Uncharacterized protein n=1 Tax=Owenia fusiformis TaxID=6347 RepID=A0A8J1UM82_OWEFU|nr:unnamed protein product [Owenia fusiformis]
MDKLATQFTFKINHVLFNNEGKYFLKVSIKTEPDDELSKLGVTICQKGDSFIDGSECFTGDILQGAEGEVCELTEREVKMKLPAGGLSDGHTTILLVEAYHREGGQMEHLGVPKLGEATFVIYPRKHPPKPNYDAKPGQNLYSYTSILQLLHVLSENKAVAAHVGRIKYTASLLDITAQETPEEDELQIPNKDETEAQPSTAAQSPDEKLDSNPQTPVNPHPHDDRPSSMPQEQTPRVGTPPKSATPLVPSLSPKMFHRPSPLPPIKSPRTPRKMTPPLTNIENQSPERGPPSEETLLDHAWNVDPVPSVSLKSQKIGNINPRCHVSREGYEEVAVLIHGASNVPDFRGRTPLPYMAMSIELNNNRKSSFKPRRVTQLLPHPTHHPVWEEEAVLELEATDNKYSALVLAISEEDENEELVQYRIPMSYLVPFHQYHLECVQGSTRLYISVRHKTSKLPIDATCPYYTGLEVLIQGVHRQLAHPVGPIVTVARVVSDVNTQSVDGVHDAKSHSVRCGLIMTTVVFPHPHPSSFTVPLQHSQGYPQVTLPGDPQDRPQWDHNFLFSHPRDKATLFTPGAGIILEFYTRNLADSGWRLQEFVGFSTVNLDPVAYKFLSSDKCSMGVQLEDIPMQGTQLKCDDGKAPMFNLVLRLLISQQPDHIQALSNLESIPKLSLNPSDPMDFFYRSVSTDLRDSALIDQIIDGHLHREDPWGSHPTEDDIIRSLTPGVKFFKQPVLHRRNNLVGPPENQAQNGVPGLPPPDAMENILPEYKYIFVDKDGKGRPPGRDLPSGNTSLHATGHREPAGPSAAPQHVNTNQRLPDDLDRTTLSLIEHQMRELENYRTAVQKMGQDILTLREELREKDFENSKLRRDIAHYEDSRRYLLDSSDMDDLTKPELAERYVVLKQRVSRENREMQEYKDRLQKLQNELIKKNEAEKEYLSAQQGQKAQQEVIQKLQSRMGRVKQLEDACKKQEKVIEKMEKIMHANNKLKNTDSSSTNDALVEENRRLRHELQDSRHHQGSLPDDDKEKLQLYETLEKAEGRILSLEKQLTENSRKWGKEKVDLQLRLTEAQHGVRERPDNNSWSDNGFHERYGRDELPDPRRFSKSHGGRKYSPKLDPIDHPYRYN